MIHIISGLSLGMLTPLLIHNSNDAFTNGAFTTALAALIPSTPNWGRSHVPVAPGAQKNRDGSGAVEWCAFSNNGKDNLPCTIVRIDGLGLDALNGHYIKEHA